MTPAEHEDAIEALAVLIGRYLDPDPPRPAGGRTPEGAHVTTTATKRRRPAGTGLGAEPGPRRVAIYIRRSTDDEHQPYSIEAQTGSLTAYVASQPGWTLVAEYTDDASGATTDRPGLSARSPPPGPGAFDVLLVSASTGSPAASPTSSPCWTSCDRPAWRSAPRPNRSTPPARSAACSSKCSACSPNSSAKRSSTA